MYTSSGPNIYVRLPNGHEEIFLTIFETDSDVSPDDQAVILAAFLNREYS